MIIYSLIKSIKIIVSVYFAGLIKSIKLQKLSKILGEPVNMTDLQDRDKKDKALDDLYALSKDFKYTNIRLEKYHIDKEKFKEIYGKLLLLGAGQWVKGHYVAASSLVFGSSLEYILEELEKSNDKDWEKISTSTPFANIPYYWQKIAFNLIEYFEKGKTGKVE